MLAFAYRLCRSAAAATRPQFDHGFGIALQVLRIAILLVTLLSATFAVLPAQCARRLAVPDPTAGTVVLAMDVAARPPLPFTR